MKQFIKRIVIYVLAAVVFVGTATAVTSVYADPDDGKIVEVSVPAKDDGKKPGDFPIPGMEESNAVTSETPSGVSQTSSANKLKKVKIKKLAKKKLSAKKIKITLKKKITGADGYQVRVYKTKKNAKKNKKIIAKKTIKKNKKTFTISKKKFRNKKKLYVRVRAYEVVNGKKVYGAWSKSKRVKLKK